MQADTALPANDSGKRNGLNPKRMQIHLNQSATRSS